MQQASADSSRSCYGYPGLLPLDCSKQSPENHGRKLTGPLNQILCTLKLIIYIASYTLTWLQTADQQIKLEPEEKRGMQMRSRGVMR